MELILFPAACVCMLVAIVYKKRYYPLFIAAGYSFFALSAIHCMFDVAGRVEANDIGGIEDIYPLLKWVYVIVLAVITLMAIIAVFRAIEADRL